MISEEEAVRLLREDAAEFAEEIGQLDITGAADRILAAVKERAGTEDGSS